MRAHDKDNDLVTSWTCLWVKASLILRKGYCSKVKCLRTSQGLEYVEENRCVVSVTDIDLKRTRYRNIKKSEPTEYNDIWSENNVVLLIIISYPSNIMSCLIQTTERNVNMTEQNVRTTNIMEKAANKNKCMNNRKTVMVFQFNHTTCV